MDPADPDSQRLAAGWQALEDNDFGAAEAMARRALIDTERFRQNLESAYRDMRQATLGP